MPLWEDGMIRYSTYPWVVFEALKIVWTGMSPVPGPGKKPVIAPEEGETVQSKVVPETFAVRLTSVLWAPEQISWNSGAVVTVGLGLTWTW